MMIRAMMMVGLLVLSCVGCSDDTPTGVAQGPIKFVLTNKSGAARYASWVDSRPLLFKLERQDGQSWVQVGIGRPGCIDQCGADNAGKECAVFCGPSFAGIRRIDDGGKVERTWDGKVYPIDKNHCSDAACFRERNPEAGTYRLSGCASDGFECGTPGCTPDTTTSINGSVSGNETCSDKQFTVPYAGDTVDVEI